jgi:hypothetical protein
VGSVLNGRLASLFGFIEFVAFWRSCYNSLEDYPANWRPQNSANFFLHCVSCHHDDGDLFLQRLLSFLESI